MTLSPMAKKILNHLREHKFLSQSEAIDLYKCLDLPGIVLELRADGQNIRVQHLTNTSNGTAYTIYRLEN